MLSVIESRDFSIYQHLKAVTANMTSIIPELTEAPDEELESFIQNHDEKIIDWDKSAPNIYDDIEYDYMSSAYISTTTMLPMVMMNKDDLSSLEGSGEYQSLASSIAEFSEETIPMSIPSSDEAYFAASHMSSQTASIDYQGISICVLLIAAICCILGWTIKRNVKSSTRYIHGNHYHV